MVGPADAAGVQQMVLDVDGGKTQLEVWDVHLNVRWGLTPPLGKMPRGVQNAHVDVKLDDALLEVDVHSRVPNF